MVYLGKFTANVQKRLKPGSFKADFLYDEKKTIPRKKKLKIARSNDIGFVVKLKF